MSEFSESYHIRISDPAQLKQQLRRAGLAGVTFGPANGWLTFVPYEELPAFRRSSGEAFTRELCRVTGAVTLQYRYAEDYGWGFAVASPDGSQGKFACWWHPEPVLENEGSGVEILGQIADPAPITALLQKFDSTAALRELPAHKFAELLRLPAHEWISPNLAQTDVEALIRQGGSKLGTRPKTLAQRLRLPPDRNLTLPRPDLSAREALTLIEPFMQKFQSDWFLARIFGGGALKKDGRLEPRNGVWDFAYANSSSGEVVRAALYPNGRLGFQAYMAREDFLSVPEQDALPVNWLDSTDAAEIVRPEAFPRAGDFDYGLWMSLRPIEDGPPIWEVGRTAIDGPPGGPLLMHKLVLHAQAGEILYETFEVNDKGRVTHSRVRNRWEGSEWQDNSSSGTVADDAG
jgi:hypothetical protein